MRAKERRARWFFPGTDGLPLFFRYHHEKNLLPGLNGNVEKHRRLLGNEKVGSASVRGKINALVQKDAIRGSDGDRVEGAGRGRTRCEEQHASYDCDAPEDPKRPTRHEVRTRGRRPGR